MVDSTSTDINERIKRLEEAVFTEGMDWPDVNVSSAEGGGGVTVEDDGTVVLDGAKILDFGTNLATTDDADDEVTVDVAGISGSSWAGIPTTTLADTEFIATRYRVPDGETLELLSLGVQNDAESAPTGLEARLYDETNATVVHGENSKYNSDDPIATIAGPVDVSFRTYNGTGSEQNASSWFQHKFE